MVSVGAALAFAMSSTLKHVSAGHVPDAQSMHPGKLAAFVRATVSHRLWLSGLACDVAGLSLQILALHLGALTVVQPLLLSSLLFALLLRSRFGHHPVSRRQVMWALVLIGGLTGFLLLMTSPTGRVPTTADRPATLVVGVLGAVVVVACIVLGRSQSTKNRRGRAAALLGTAVGIIYATTAALIKAATNIAAHDLTALFASWQLYTVIALGAAGMLLGQLTFQAGPLTASLPATAAVDPLASIVIGVAVYGEEIRNGLSADLLLVLLLVVLGSAVVQLGRAREES